MQKSSKRLRRFHTLLLALCIGNASAAAVESIHVPTAGISSAAVALVAHLFKPAGPGPHPAVLMMHGCGGAYNSQGELSARHQMWGEILASHGYIALMLDSFSARNSKEICRVKFDERKVKESDGVGDAYAALAWLRQRSDVDPSRIGILGWSYDGGVTLATISHQPEHGKGFSAAISFYPGCSARNRHADRFHPYAPLLVLMGEADDWTPAAPCKALTDTVAGRNEPMRIVLYPDSYHDFDNPSLTTKRVRKDVPNGVHPGQGVTVAPNAQAREDAKRRVLAFLGEVWK
ncbi:MAG: dienelactone hydrolase family protein [Rhodoferax sp.]|nr:dienelactone hydrolase family protein [Rhodoferax sp.]